MNLPTPDEDLSRLFPPQPGDYDPNQDGPLPADLPGLNLTKRDVINLRAWLADGCPRLWRGENMFPDLSDVGWLVYRQLVRQKWEDSKSGGFAS